MAWRLAVSGWPGTGGSVVITAWSTCAGVRHPGSQKSRVSCLQSLIALCTMHCVHRLEIQIPCMTTHWDNSWKHMTTAVTTWPAPCAPCPPFMFFPNSQFFVWPAAGGWCPGDPGPWCNAAPWQCTVHCTVHCTVYSGHVMPHSVYSTDRLEPCSSV